MEIQSEPEMSFPLGQKLLAQRKETIYELAMLSMPKRVAVGAPKQLNEPNTCLSPHSTTHSTLFFQPKQFNKAMNLEPSTQKSQTPVMLFRGAYSLCYYYFGVCSQSKYVATNQQQLTTVKRHWRGQRQGQRAKECQV